MLPQIIPALHRVKRVFYIDATGGNDANNGRSRSLAWQTMGKVNGETFKAGDYVLFKRGETWTGTTLTIAWSGKRGAPIVFGAYGVGANPIIDGNDVVNCIVCNSKHNITFQNIRATQGLDFGFYILGNATRIDILSCEADNCGNDNVIFVGAVSVGPSDCKVIDLDSHDPYERVGGARVTCLEIADAAHDIEVINSEFYGSEDAGLSIHNHVGDDFPYNITIRNCYMHDNDNYGFFSRQVDPGVVLPGDSNIEVINCTFEDNADVGAGANIYFAATGQPYPSGVEFTDCISITTTERPLYVGSASATFIRCLFVGQWATRLETALEVTFYNCTFYCSTDAIRVFDLKTSITELVARNCIFYYVGTVIIDLQVAAGVDIDYCLYYCEDVDPTTSAVYKWNGALNTWANWLINSGQDANSHLPADPLFVNPGAGDFTLQAGSPAIDAGVDVGLPFEGSAPDCGYAERE